MHRLNLFSIFIDRMLVNTADGRPKKKNMSKINYFIINFVWLLYVFGLVRHNKLLLLKRVFRRLYHCGVDTKFVFNQFGVYEISRYV